MASTSRDGAAERAGPACVTGRPDVEALPAGGPEGRIVLTVAEATGIVMHIVLAANPQADQPWVADAAAALVKQTGATIAVVSVDEVELERFAPAPREVYLERAEQAADAAVQRLAAHGVEATRAVLSGRAVDRILEFAEEQRADLIVVGGSTRPALAARLLGSVPLTLVEKSPRPVTIITHPEAAQP
jgi:nucleotide-binding universal stress UspA family protein